MAWLAVNARAEGGWHNTGQAFANLSDKVGPVAFSIGGGYYTTDGISAYAAVRLRRAESERRQQTRDD